MKLNKKEIIAENKAMIELSDGALDRVTGGSRPGTEARVGDWVVHRSQKPGDHVVYQVQERNGNYLTLLKCEINRYYEESVYPMCYAVSYVIVDKPSWVRR